jgi:threonyl-tRNA synthetase
VIGEKEVNKSNLSVRDRESGDVKEIPLDEFVNEIKEQTKNKPFTKLNLARHLSKRPQIMV